MNALIAVSAANAQAHDAFLRFAASANEGLAQVMNSYAKLAELAPTTGDAVMDWPVLPAPKIESPARQDPTFDLGLQDRGSLALQPLAFDYDACMEFAVGKIANVLGPEYAEVDWYPVRVRLPGAPLMLVHRILSVAGERKSLGAGCVITEHDVASDAWYLDHGCCPICITVEAGQADLFLCSYLGIDLAVKGKRPYRLLDATVTFHRGLPRPGEVIRYEIHIDRFVRQGETYLFFFRFEGTIDGVPMLSMQNGCAGFFTHEEIENSGGIILSKEDQADALGKRTGNWRELVPMSREFYSDIQVTALRNSDLAGCFGSLFAHLNLRDPLRLPGGHMKLFDRVLELDPAGGRFGLGMIRAEADIHPDDWFLTCHFIDDMTMPGTLMYECCMHTLRFYLLRMGWVGEQAGVTYEPIAEIPSALKCRGPVTPSTKQVVYQVEIKEIGYGPEPYVIADALMYGDGRCIVQMKNMSLRVLGLTRETIEATWNRRSAKMPRDVVHSASRNAKSPAGALYDRDRILAFAIGKPSEAFGEPYRVFDQKRRIARLPGPPYAFMDRVMKIEPEAWKLQPGGWIETEYDIPADAWYFRENRQSSMAYCILLEAALQPCGWLAAYLGSALKSETDLSFRNLGGRATLHRELFPDSGTLTARVRMTSVSEAGGMIIEKFDMQLLAGGQLIYDGDTAFGFFSAEALSRQVGIRDAVARAYQPSVAELVGKQELVLSKMQSSTNTSAALPADMLRMVDRVTCLLPDGGPNRLGYIRGEIDVDPGAWFFKAHFYQDPVWPGSLGLESLLQLLKVFALKRWPEMAATHRFEPIAVGVEHQWAYRGQIIPTNRKVQVEAVITEIKDGETPLVKANGLLKVDGTYIYEMTDFGIRLVPA